MTGAPLFQVGNHHVEGCGTPPAIDDSAPQQRRGYFENEHGEQAIFVYDYPSKRATLWLGDAGWERPYMVTNGGVPGLILNEPERLWLRACWLAATA